MDDDISEQPMTPATDAPQATPKKVSQPARPAPKVQVVPKREVPKHKKRHIVRVSDDKPMRRSSDSSPGMMIAVYILLGLAVLGTSFYVGFLVGKGGSGTTQTGSLNTGVNGALQIVEYSDYQCPFCGAVEPTVEQLRKQYGDKIEVTYKNFPLDSIHPRAMPSAIAAECARDQSEEDFWKYHDKLFANQQALEDTNLKQYAKDLGLDVSKFNDCFDNKKTLARVQADQQEGLAKGVQGTPSFWIKDELLVGAQPLTAFQQKIDDKLAGKAAAPAPTQTEPSAPKGKVDVAMGPHVMGDAKAPVTIVEFSDFQCPFCKRFYTDTEQQIIDTYVKTGKAKLSYRHFPLSFHQTAQKAAEAAECASDQGKFWEMHDVMFTKGNGDGTGLAVDDLKKYAADLKLDTTKFNKCLDNGDKADVVKKDQSDGSAAGVTGTPSFVVNGVMIVGAVPFSNFKSTIDAALAG